MNRTDIHFHILPAVDDGPCTLDESVELARAAVAEGTGVVVATPHVRGDYATDVDELVERTRELRAALHEAGVPLQVELGAELGHEMVARLRQAELELVATGPPGARWVLVESPFEGFADEFTAATDELRDRGFAVVVAHPERAAGGRDAALRHEVERGSMLQVNAWSLAGRHGGEARAVARRLIADQLPVVVASDAHGGWRMPALGLAVQEIGAEAERLVRAVPRRLLEKGLGVPVGASTAYRPSQSAVCSA